MTVVATRIWVDPSAKACHRGILVAAFHLAVDEPNLAAENLLQLRETLLRGGDIERLAFLDKRTHPEGAGALPPARA